MVFQYAVPVLLVGFLLTWLLREMPLRTRSADGQRDEALTGAVEEAAGPAGELDPEPVHAVNREVEALAY
jgi:hypothetical protein